MVDVIEQPLIDASGLPAFKKSALISDLISKIYLIWIQLLLYDETNGERVSQIPPEAVEKIKTAYF